MTRTCKACHKPLVRWPKEVPSHFSERKCCDLRCSRSIHHGGMPRGHKMSKKQVPCVHGCGTMLWRAHHFVSATCPVCEEVSRKKRQAGTLRRLREQARRYRILLALSPYGGFEELREALRVRNPKSWQFSYDMTLERRWSA